MNVNTRILNLTIIFLACAGLFVAGYLTYTHLAGVQVACGMSGNGCQLIQNHPSSKWFGIPVAAYGVLGYLSLIVVASIRAISGDSLQWLKVGFGISLVGAIVSIVLQIYGAIAVRATCDWCLASTGIMCGLAVLHSLLLQNVEATAPPQPSRLKVDFTAIAILLVGSGAGLGMIAMANQGGSGEVISENRLEKEDDLVIGAPSMGPADAPVTIVEFADLFCGSCQVSFAHMKKLQAEYPGKIRWVFRHFPLFNKEGHELALPAAVVAEMAQRQGKFWEFIGQIYSMDHEALKTMDAIYQVAKNVNVNVTGGPDVISDENSLEMKRVVTDINMAGQIGIMETPTFVMLIKGERPVALRRKDLDARLNSAQLQALLRG